MNRLRETLLLSLHHSLGQPQKRWTDIMEELKKKDLDVWQARKLCMIGVNSRFCVGGIGGA